VSGVIAHGSFVCPIEIAAIVAALPMAHIIIRPWLIRVGVLR
jgi:hypothetical protein